MANQREEAYIKFREELHNSIEGLLDKGLDKLKTSITKEISKRENGVNETDIENACAHFFNLLRDRMNLNFDKFDLYTRRNILVKRVIPVGSSSQQQSNLSTNSTEEKLNRLRQKYVELQQNYANIIQRHKDTELLLSEMQTAYYNLKVGFQVFDAENTLEMSLASLKDRLNALKSLSISGQDTILKIQQLQASSITNVVRPQASHSSTGGSISTSGDIKQLTSSIRKDQRG